MVNGKYRVFSLAGAKLGDFIFADGVLMVDSRAAALIPQNAVIRLCALDDLGKIASCEENCHFATVNGTRHMDSLALLLSETQAYA